MASNRLASLGCAAPVAHRAAWQGLIFFFVTAWLLLGPTADVPAFASGESPWQDHRMAGIFVCHADFPLADVGSLLDELGQLQQDLRDTLKIPPAEESVHLCLFKSKAGYDRYLKTHLPKMPYRRAFFVKRPGMPGTVLAYRGDEFEVDVRHECVHALLHAVLPVVPLWLDEGLAEYFEVPRMQRARGNPTLPVVRKRSEADWSAQLASLENANELGQMGREEYQAAWAWVHFLIHGPPAAQRELLRYLVVLRVDGPPAGFRQRLQTQIPSLDRAIVDHFDRWPPPLANRPAASAVGMAGGSVAPK
jgi:hypothetical protein